jgi:GT2 family glycosyltransferase
MDYAVVISTLNRKRSLGKTIDSIFKQTIKPKEFMIMLDRNSNIENMAFLLKYKKKYPLIRIYHSKENLGACTLINLGVKKATSEYILNIDDDAILPNEDWVELSYKNFRDNVGLIWGNVFGTLNFAKFGEFFIGCVFVTRKDIFQEVGMFDEKLFIYSNDTDLAIRLNRYGYRVLPLKKRMVIHPYGPPGPKFYEFASSNRLLLYWKYYPYWVSFIMTIFHVIQEIREMRDYSLLKFWLKGMKRFISKLYWIGLSYKDRMTIVEFLKSSYQLHFPSLGYYLVRFLYGL